MCLFFSLIGSDLKSEPSCQAYLVNINFTVFWQGTSFGNVIYYQNVTLIIQFKERVN